MDLLSLLLLAVGLSMDAFAVAVCKGLALKKITLRHALIVGLWFGGFQALMPLIGWLLGSQFAQMIQSVDHWIVFFLLGGIGGLALHLLGGLDVVERAEVLAGLACELRLAGVLLGEARVLLGVGHDRRVDELLLELLVRIDELLELVLHDDLLG